MTDINLEVVKKLRTHGILTNVGAALLPRNTSDIIIAACSDNTQHEEKRLHLSKFVRSQKPFLYAGGGCLPGTPRRVVGQQGVQMLEALLKAAKQHQPSAVVLSGHYPCRWATARGLGLQEQIFFLIQAYYRMRDLLRVHPHNLTKVDVYIFLHIWDGQKNRTYKVSLF